MKQTTPVRGARFSLLVFAIAAAGLCCASLHAQEPYLAAVTIAQGSGTIRGVVRSAELQPLRDAVVTLEGTDKSVRTRADGKFEFRDLAAGPYEVVARRVGMTPDARSVAVRGNAKIDLVFVLASISALDTSRTIGKSLHRAEYDDRRSQNIGYAVDSAVLNHRSDLFSALSNLPLTRVVRSGSGISIKIRSMGTTQACDPLPFLDGLPTSLQHVSTLPPDSFRAIEVLPWEVTPQKYLDGRRCVGAILFWSKKAPW